MSHQLKHTPPPTSGKIESLVSSRHSDAIPQDLEKVNPVRPAAPYCGGKRRLASLLDARISSVPHNTYAEPFMGMGGVFFRRCQKPKSEIINDLNGEVSNFFRVIQRHYIPFMDVMKFQLTSRCEFERMKATDPRTLTDLERAVRFFYLQKTAFGGKVTQQTFGVNTGGLHARFDYSKVGPLLEKIYQRLSGVVIESLPYEALILRYDRPGTLFYLDPPYWDSEACYGKGLFQRSDFESLSKLLAQLKGRFILSINDTPEIRTLFAGFQIEEVQTGYSISQRQQKSVCELIISNSVK